MRPAHIHLMVSVGLSRYSLTDVKTRSNAFLIRIHQITHPDYHSVITQLYPDDDPHLATDSVFAVKTDLVVHFDPLEGDDNAKLELKYDIQLGSKQIMRFAESRL